MWLRIEVSACSCLFQSVIGIFAAGMRSELYIQI